MGSLSPPTDDLYKFVAIAGVLLVLLCIQSGVRVVIGHNVAAAEARVQVAAYNARLHLREEEESTKGKATSEEVAALTVRQAELEAITASLQNEKS